MSNAPDDVYAITEKGANELKGGATTLAPKELELLVLVDGRRTSSAIGKLAKANDPSQVAAALQKLATGGFIRASAPQNDGFDFTFPDSPAAEPSEQALKNAEREAEMGALQLRDQGYYVSIARRAKVQAHAARPPLTVLVVEDEPLVAKFLKSLVETEGHGVRVAGNLDEIAAGLSKLPLPDLVLLDVVLPDTNGFDVLQRMKGHPRFAPIPVVMVTTQASRESVMKGLALGADGYFTKPFEVDVLMRGMKAVLGQLAPGRDAPPAKKNPWN